MKEKRRIWEGRDINQHSLVRMGSGHKNAGGFAPENGGKKGSKSSEKGDGKWGKGCFMCEMNKKNKRSQ